METLVVLKPPNQPSMFQNQKNQVNMPEILYILVLRKMDKVELRKLIAKNGFEIKRGIQESDVGQRMLIELKISKSTKGHEKNLLKGFGSKASEKDLAENLAVMERILNYVRTLPGDKQIELGKRIFGASFGELRRKRRMG